MLLLLCTRFSKICCEFYTGIESQFGLTPFKCPLATVAIILDNTAPLWAGGQHLSHCLSDFISSPSCLLYPSPLASSLFPDCAGSIFSPQGFACAGVLVPQTSVWIPCSYPLLCSNVTSSLGLYWFVRAAITHTMDQVASRWEIVTDQGVSSTGFSWILFPWLVGDYFFRASSQDFPFVCLCVHISLLIRIPVILS